jgi:predicted membrane protein
MDETAIKNYLASDYAKAVKFYDDRANSSKRWYRVLSIYVIAVSAGLTVLVSFAPDALFWKILSAAVSATIVVATGLLAHLRCHENWLSYRGSWDALERERRFYQTGTGAYNSAADKGALFVERVESILTKEGADFYARHAKGDEQAKVRAK